MNIKEALVWANSELSAKEVREPESSALVLLGDVLSSEKRKAKGEKGWDRAELLAHPEKKLSAPQQLKFRKYISRRKKHESVWHIIGKVQFCGLDYVVNKDVLVPRPETELLVEQVVRQIAKPMTNDQRPMTILDIGTGSGTIAIALAKELKKQNKYYKIVATDISRKALRVAKKNAKLNAVSSQIEFIEADLYRPVTKNELLNTKFDIITANLPYIPGEDMESLAIDVYHYEPKLALDGGLGGLKIYEKMLAGIPEHLNPRGKVFCEIGINQGEEFRILVKKYLPQAKVEILGDLAGIDRVAIITLTNK